MNKTVFLLLLTGLFSCTEKRPEIKPETNQGINKTEKLARIEFDEEMHDFGHVKSGEILVWTFVFSNRGENELFITNAEADCGCLNVNFQKEPVKPGKKAYIEVQFNSAGMVGKQLKTIEIQSNSKEPKHLIIFAEVENELFEIKN